MTRSRCPRPLFPRRVGLRADVDGVLNPLPGKDVTSRREVDGLEVEVSLAGVFVP